MARQLHVLQAGPSLRHRRTIARAVVIIVAMLLGALPVLVLPKLTAFSREPEQPEQLSAEADAHSPASGFLAALEAALHEVKLLQAQVETGQVVPKFGEKAQVILAGLSASGPEIEAAVDGALQALFLQQLGLLRQQVATKFEKGSQPIDAVARADLHFRTEAETLRPPGSSWSYDFERHALRSALEGAFRRNAQLAEERARLQQSQQATMEVIGRLQNQMATKSFSRRFRPCAQAALGFYQRHIAFQRRHCRLSEDTSKGARMSS